MKTIETQIEELEKLRIRWLLVFLIGYIVWGGFRIIDGHLIEGGVAPLFQLILLLGWVTWTLGIVQLLRLGSKVKKIKQASQVLNDELVEFNRLKSFRLALIVVILTQGVIIILSVFSFDISGLLSAEISIFAAASTAISAFIYYDKTCSNG